MPENTPEIHCLKTIQPHYNELKEGRKTFELRRLDRDVLPGDLLLLQEYSKEYGYTGMAMGFVVTHMLEGSFGLKDGYGCLSIRQVIDEHLSFHYVETAAQIAHEVNRGYCASLGDFSHKPWDQIDEDLQRSALEGADHVLAEKITSPEKSHEGWSETKIRQGWKYGPAKDPKKKEHPCLVPFDELPPEQKLKDTLFISAVNSVRGIYIDLSATPGGTLTKMIWEKIHSNG